MNNNYESEKKLWESKRDNYNYLIETGENDYLIRAMRDIINLALDNDQLRVPESDEYFECNRVINVKRVLPIEELKKGHPELFVFEGVYLVVKGIAISKTIIDSAKDFRGVIDESKLPEGYVYGSLKDVHGSYYFAPARDEQLMQFLYGSRGYEVFVLK